MLQHANCSDNLDNTASKQLSSSFCRFTDLSFFNHTYQVKIPVDLNETDHIWCFIKLNPMDYSVIEHLCGCHESSKQTCIHINTALNIIFIDGKPINEIFETSCFYQLFKSIYDLSPTSSLILDNDNIQIFYQNSCICSITALSKTAQEDTLSILNKAPETPSSSIKFSEIPDHAIKNWENGNFNDPELFIISPLYEIAESIFLHCLTFDVNFSVNEMNKIASIETRSEHFACRWNLQNLIFDWKTLLVSINKNHSNYTILPAQPKIASVTVACNNPLQINIIYDVNTAYNTTLYDQKLSQNTHFSIEHGFFITYDQNVCLYENDAKAWLINNQKEIINNLCSYINDDEIQYNLFFDDSKNLHIHPFIFQHNDLDLYGFIVSKNLLYTESHGFIDTQKITKRLQKQIIPYANIDKYIEQNTDFLNSIHNYSIIINHSQANTISYNVHENGDIFFIYSDDMYVNHKTIEFEDWIYIENMGFLKKQSIENSPLNKALIPQPDVSSFIDDNLIFLNSVKGFFSNQDNPILSINIQAKLVSAQKLEIAPIFSSDVDITNKQIALYKNYIYIQEHGFFYITSSENIPIEYHTKKILSKNEIYNFYTIDCITLTDRVVFSPVTISKPKQFSFIINSLSKMKGGLLNSCMLLSTDLGEDYLYNILHAIKKKQSFLFSPAGFLDFSNSFFSFIAYLHDHLNADSNNVILSVIDFLKLHALAGTSLNQTIKHDDTTVEIFNKLKEFCVPIPPSPNNAQHSLRPYQKTGLMWLWFLYINGLSGLLCDDMGLGKTHQAISLLDVISHSDQSENALFLIVAPTSVIFHWEEMLTKYLSNENIYLAYKTKKTDALPKTGVIITSYGMLRHRNKLFENICFEAAIFDEIQVAKNKSSRIYKILRDLNAKMKLGLTGTPIENNVFELKALFDIILPNYMPSDMAFKKIFAKKVSSNQEEEEDTPYILNMIRPFILRRTKAEVLPELPPKVESISYASLSPCQYKLYSQMLNKEAPILKQLNENQAVVPYLHIFALLNSLKQICNHPALFLKQIKDYKSYSCDKWDIFIEILQNALLSEQKVVVFSQYLGMIDIICLHLSELGVEYAVIKGDSKNRQQEINRFKSDPNCKVFVGSLLSTGLGINLTEGNAVILYDRWWNPAKENQALDRVHRIGQNKTVFVYKIITKDSVEEKIDLIIRRKTDLFNDIVQNNQNVLRLLNKEDLITILSYSEQDS